MKQYLILAGLLSAAIAHAQEPQPVPKKVSDARAATAEPAAVPPAAVPAKMAGPRQLSAEEKAELRRQLYQYSRLSSKGS